MHNGKPINICIPTVNNYQGLEEELASIEAGSIKPDNYFVFNNGGNFRTSIPRVIIYNSHRVSLATAWNWFIDHVAEYRIIINDDLIFYPNTLEAFLNGLKEDQMCFPYGLPRLNSFSFFSLPDNIVNEVGRFDDEFYPAYFEDNSYDYKMNLKGYYVYGIPDCSVIHKGSQTLAHYTQAQIKEHHQNFEKNRKLYIQMWGGTPKNEKYATKYNR